MRVLLFANEIVTSISCRLGSLFSQQAFLRQSILSSNHKWISEKLHMQVGLGCNVTKSKEGNGTYFNFDWHFRFRFVHVNHQCFFLLHHWIGKCDLFFKSICLKLFFRFTFCHFLLSFHFFHFRGSFLRFVIRRREFFPRLEFEKIYKHTYTYIYISQKISTKGF